jgi:hypothetical protein
MSRTSKPRRRDGGTRSGGVTISGRARVDVGGDLVGGNKTVGGAPPEHLDALFSALIEAVQGTPSLGNDQKTHLLTATNELKRELTREKPDLGKLDRLKALLSAHGGQIASATGGIFSYAPVQETVKAAMQRLLGG